MPHPKQRYQKLPTVLEIIEQISELAQKYETLYRGENDIKALQGHERCLEMKMKILGLDGKNQPLQPSENQNPEKISINELPTELIEQILKTIKTMKQQKQ